MQDDPGGEETGAAFRDVPVQVTVTIGRARPTIGDLMSMSPATILTLDRGLEDPVELFVGDKLIARGQLEELDEPGSGRLGVRVTDVVAPRGAA